MPTPVENLTALAITTLAVLMLFAIIPGTIAVITGFIIGIVASLPILAIGSLTRLVGQDSPRDEED